MSASGHPSVEAVRWSGQPPAPPPPSGPGVQPPFVAPPSDGTSRRRWMAFGLSAGAALLACVLGIVSCGGVLYLGYQATAEQARATVVDYLSALRDHEYGRAYGLLCDRLQGTMSREAFERSKRDEPWVSSFDVGEPELTDQIVVPATVHYVSSTTRKVRYVIYQDTETGAFEVCGETN